MSLISKLLAGSVLFVLLANPGGAAAAELKGTVLAVFADKQSLIVADDDGGQWTLFLDNQAKVVVGNQAGTLADVMAGDYVRVVHQVQGQRMVATEIRCQRDAGDSEDEPAGR